jgi:hypothetical protein
MKHSLQIFWENGLYSQQQHQNHKCYLPNVDIMVAAGGIYLHV